MATMNRKRKPKGAAEDELQVIPGVGPRTSAALREIGVQKVADLRGRDPRVMYDHLCAQRGEHIDRCVLYVFRCAVYFAGRKRHDAELLKWWNWKDRD